MKLLLIVIFVLSCSKGFSQSDSLVELKWNQSLAKVSMTHKKFKKKICADDSVFFNYGDCFTLSIPLNSALKKDHLYTISFLSNNHDSTNANDYGCEFWSKKSYIINPVQTIGFPKSEELYLKAPYYRLTAPKVDNDIRQHIFQYLADGSEQLFVIRVASDQLFKNVNGLIVLSNFQIKDLGHQDIWFFKQENLIPNGDFELYKRCPENLVADNNFHYWQFIPLQECIDWRDRVLEERTIVDLDKRSTYNQRGVILNTPDLVCACSGLDTCYAPSPQQGNAFARIISGSESKILGSEYLQVSLSKPLEKGKKYALTFHYRLAPYSNIGNNLLGFKISKCPFSMDSFYESKSKFKYAEGTALVSPDSIIDNFSWKVYKYEFLSSGEENFLTIGCYNNENLKYKKLRFKNICSTITSLNDDTIFFVDNVSLKIVP